MPSPRKRIGFLPRVEVQLIIDKISKDNNLSQSKVTGLLVEEAISIRSILKNNINESILNSNEYKDYKKLILEDKSMNYDLKMINEFIEFKFFKKIMNQIKYFPKEIV